MPVLGACDSDHTRGDVDHEHSVRRVQIREQRYGGDVATRSLRTVPRQALRVLGHSPRTDSPIGAEPAVAPEDLYSRFFTLSMDMLALAGVDGYFKVLNGAWTDTLGFTEEELLSQPYLDFVHPDDQAATVAEATKLADGFPTIHFRNRYRCKDGSYKWLAWTATAAMADGTIYAAARDVTCDVVAEDEARRRTQDQLTRVQAALAGGAIRAVFQPIVDMKKLDACGYEALSRFDIDPDRSPDKWFEDAGATGLRTQLELRAISTAITQADRLPDRSFLSINASPDTLIDEDFRAAAAELEGNRVVVEVTENAAVEDYEPLKKAIERLRHAGMRLAIDDAGAGYASMKHIVRLAPDFIKLDIFLIRDINIEPLKRAVVGAMVAVAAEIGADLIAEGVETPEELSTLIDLDVHKAQGFYLGRPGPLPGTRNVWRGTHQRRRNFS
jgi:PAS domain S-box-containing protein